MEFRKYGKNYTLTIRAGRVVFYVCRTPGGESRGSEVMVIQNKEPASIKQQGKPDRVMPGGEALPSSSMWGVFGFSYLPTESERAHEKFHHLSRRFNPQPERRLTREH